MLHLGIFDLDQTLLDTLHRFHRIFNRTLHRLGAAEIGWDEFIREYARDALRVFIPGRCEEFWDIFLRSYNDIICKKDHVIPGAMETLRDLKERDIPVVITTGRMVPHEVVEEELRKFSMEKYVDHVYTRQDFYEDGKRKIEMLRRAMKDFDVKPKNAVFVGDYWPDMESGRVAGVFTIGVLTGLQDESVLRRHGAQEVIPSVKELISLLRRRGLL